MSEPDGVLPSRRAFLAGAAGLTGVAVASSAWRPTTAGAAQEGGAGAQPTATGGELRLVLGNNAAGAPIAFEGGFPAGEVVVENSSGQFNRKHIGAVKYEDMTIVAGHGFSKGFYEWIKASFDGTPLRKSGELQAADFKRERRAVSFTNALISEFGLPALDAASKDAAKMTLKFSPATTALKAKDAVVDAPKKQKQWLPANFRLSIGDLDCKRVNKIEAITVKQTVVNREPAKLEFPNLKITLAEGSADTWFAWAHDFLVRGRNGQSQERQGSLEYLNDDGEMLFRLDFEGLGLYRLAPPGLDDPSPNSIRRIKAEMYCERMSFSYGPAAVGTPPAGTP